MFSFLLFYKINYVGSVLWNWFVLAKYIIAFFFVKTVQCEFSTLLFKKIVFTENNMIIPYKNSNKTMTWPKQPLEQQWRGVGDYYYVFHSMHLIVSVHNTQLWYTYFVICKLCFTNIDLGYIAIIGLFGV